MIYKIAFDGLRYIILIMTIIGMVTENIIFNKLVLFVFLIMILSYLLSGFISKSNINKNKLLKIIPFLGIITAIVFSYYSTKSSLVFILFTIIYLSIWIVSLRLKDESYSNDDVFKKIILTSLIATIFSLDIFMGNTRWFMNDLVPYIIIFIIVSFIYSIRLNLYNAYLDNNAINKSKNLKIFNVLSNIIIIFIMLIILYFSFGISNMELVKTKIYPVLEFVINPLIFIVSILYKFFKKIFPDFKLKETPQENSLNLENSDNNLLEENIEQNEIAQVVLNYLGYFLVAFIIATLVYIIYRISKNIDSGEKSNDNIIVEEKEFIFNRKNIINNIKNKFKKNTNNNTNKNMHIIRLIFIDISNSMIQKGYEYKKNFTPREFIFQNKKDLEKTKEFIDTYEKVRYGKKSIGEEDMMKIYKYKDDFNRE
ncbi:MAG: hypothetical protein ACTHVE_05040 [Senegalia sp. (in: firmicutes)]|uniref:hypothetical protein n=1 Tax=Senegalia sp. (in: firmicutes) TaxID=1924098 RepID=UPI003F9D9E36